MKKHAIIAFFIHHPDKREIRSTQDRLLRELDDARLPQYTLGKRELFTIPSGDGYDLPSTWTLSQGFDKSK